jgi:TRAP-type transport system periplasmic protein
MMYRDRIAELSKGEISVTPMVTGELGSEETILSGLRRGRVQVANLSGLVIGTLVPEVALLQTPYLFESTAEADYVYDAVLFDIFSGLLAEYGLTFLSWDEVGFHQIYGKTPILVPDDLAGVRFRVPSGLAARLFAESVASDLIPLSFTENIIGLQTGLVDAGANAVILYAGTGIAEEAPHLSLTRHMLATNFLICSSTWLNGLSLAQQKIIRTAWMPVEQARAMSRAEEDDFLKRANDIGFSVHDLSAAQLEAWQRASKHVAQKLIETIGRRSEEIYQAIQNSKTAFSELSSVK